MKEANIPTLADHLQEYLTHPDVVERMKPRISGCDPLPRAFIGLCKTIGAIFLRAAESPPSIGYEPWLVSRGVNPILARMMARLTVRRGMRIADNSKRRLAVVKAIRFLAKPSRRSPAISRKIEVLLTAWEETSIIEEIFGDAGLDEFIFVELLKSAAQGSEADSRRVTEIAAALVPRVSISRGRKVSAASAAHEFFLECLARPIDANSDAIRPGIPI